MNVCYNKPKWPNTRIVQPLLDHIYIRYILICPTVYVWMDRSSILIRSGPYSYGLNTHIVWISHLLFYSIIELKSKCQESNDDLNLFTTLRLKKFFKNIYILENKKAFFYLITLRGLSFYVTWLTITSKFQIISGCSVMIHFKCFIAPWTWVITRKFCHTWNIK